MENSQELLSKIEGSEKFQTYLKLLLSYNQKFNLTSITKEREILIKHFLDSALGEDMIPENALVADVGAGAGFPSMPLKILREDLSFVLFESTGKKCEFLETVIKELSLSNVEIKKLRAEEAGRSQEYREKFDCCLARAVARMNTLAEYCLPLVKEGGRFLAYKGDAEEELVEAERAICILGGKTEKIQSFSLPEDMGKRQIVLIRKIKPTPAKYPRGQGKERRNPIL